jgi:sulfite exporter TauE/SafE
MTRIRAYVVLALGVLLILIGLLEGDSANWVRIVQVAAGVILLVDGVWALGRETGPKPKS